MAELFGVVTANSLTWPQKRGFPKSQRNQMTLLNKRNQVEEYSLTIIRRERSIPKTHIGLDLFQPHPLTSAARMMASEISRIDLRSFMLFC